MGHLESVVGRVVVSPADAIAADGPLIGVTCSRLGHDPRLHRTICRFLVCSLLQCRSRGGTLLIASGSAIEPWAIRAAELFAVSHCLLSVNQASTVATGTDQLWIHSSDQVKLSRDRVLIALADRVDAVYVRPGGKIEKCLTDRIMQRQDATTRVAVTGSKACAAAGLMKAGAIGWMIGDHHDSQVHDRAHTSISTVPDTWTRTDGEWLVHCTRGRRGPWPGETQQFYRDTMLLGNDRWFPHGPLQALARIINNGKLIADSGTTKRSNPVVCFSAVPLRELLSRRCFRRHLGRWDYEPYGIAVRLAAAKRIGVRPVIYGKAAERCLLHPDDHFRFHPVGKSYDWRQEREWRSPASIDLGKLDSGDVRLFVNESADLALLPPHCPWPVTVLGGETIPGSDLSKRSSRIQDT